MRERTGTKPRRAALAGSWPRAAADTIERALARNGGPIQLVPENRMDAIRLERSQCQLLFRQDGRTWYGGEIPLEGVIVDGITLVLELQEAGPGYGNTATSKRSEFVSLPTDVAVGYEDDDLEIGDVRPITTRQALMQNGGPLALFLAGAFPHLDAQELEGKARALARQAAASQADAEEEPRPFAIEEIDQIGISVDAKHPMKAELYNAGQSRGGRLIAELASSTWGHVRKLGHEDRAQYGLPPEAAALLSWIDGTEENAPSDVQTLTAAEADRITAESTGAIVDDILDYYRKAGGGDDGHPAYRLHVLNRRRRRERENFWNDETESR